MTNTKFNIFFVVIMSPMCIYTQYFATQSLLAINKEKVLGVMGFCVMGNVDEKDVHLVRLVHMNSLHSY